MTAPAAPAAAPAAAADPVAERVVAIVSQKTGYPADLLDMDLDLEADLGVDTVKQAETFAAVREEWSIPRVESLRLRDFPTLRHVVGFVHTHRPDLAAPAPAPAVNEAPIAAATAPPAAPAEPAGSSTPAPAMAPAAPAPRPLQDADRVPRRVAVPVLRPPLHLCKPTGVQLGAGSRVIVARAQGGDALARKLAELGASPLDLDARQPAAAVESTVRGWLADGPIQGVFWLPALDPEPRLDEAALDVVHERIRVAVKNLASTMRVLYASVAGRGSFLVAGTRLGGLFGLGDDGTDAPLAGAVQGFVKAFRRERRDALVKVVDFGGAAAEADVADGLVAEALADPGTVEVGRRAGARWSIGLELAPVTPSPSVRLDRDTVFLVTGAAGGITSAIVADLAAASGGTFHLLDVVDPPPADDPHVVMFRAGREPLKEALIAEARERREKPTPAAIDRRLMLIERREAALRALESVRAAGGTAYWHTVDLLDAASVQAAVDAIRSASGRIDVLVHAAGLEISRALPDKTDEEWARVFDVKAEGFLSLLRAARDLAIQATVVFSSVAGRFGNAGQTDYSAANALLCSTSRWLHRSRPETRAVAIDWTAWGGMGMATRGSIPQIMEAAGIDLLAPEVGIPTVRRELLAGVSDEIVVGGRLGMLVEEWDETGGLDPERTETWLAKREHPLVMIGRVTGAPLYGGLAVETRLDPDEQPFLFDHQIDGVPVLPGVMAVEAFAEVASLFCPEAVVTGVQDIEYRLAFKFHRTRPATLYLTAVGRPGPGEALQVEVQLSSLLQPRQGMRVHRRLHSRARVTIEAAAPGGKAIPFQPPDQPNFDDLAIYRVFFHGPAYRVLEAVRIVDGRGVGIMRRELPPNTRRPGAAELVAPRLVELFFQTAGMFDVARRNSFGLPAALESLRLLQPAPAAGVPLFAEVWPRGKDGGFDGRVVDAEGKLHLELSGYRTVELPAPQTLVELHETVAEGATP